MPPSPVSEAADSSGLTHLLNYLATVQVRGCFASGQRTGQVFVVAFEKVGKGTDEAHVVDETCT
jgi:hypothetical protein